LAEVRANWTRIVLDYYERKLPPAALAALAAVVTPELRASLEAAGPLAWLPASIHMRILPAPRAALGAPAYRALWRGMMTVAFEERIFRSFVRGAISVFRSLPNHIFRVVPQGFKLIARDCGEFVVRVHDSGDEVVLAWNDVPAELLTDDAFAEAWAGTFESVLDLTQTRGEVVVSSRSPARVVFTVHLKPQ